MAASKVKGTTESQLRDCIICSKASPLSELIKPKDEQSREVLLDAAKTQKFQPITDLQIDEYVSKLLYHRNCRATFTHKKRVKAFEETTEEHDSTAEVRKSVRSKEGASTSRVLDDVCIFCGKKTKYFTGTKTREPLSQSLELRSDERIRDAATKKLDEKILALTSRDLVAAEAKYHKSCYKVYTRPDKPKVQTESDSDPAEQYQHVEKQAYKELFDHVRAVLFNQPHVVKLTELTEVLVKAMITLGCADHDIKPQTKKHIKRKLEAEFSGSLHFTQNKSGRVLVYPDNITVEILVQENNKLREEAVEQPQCKGQSLVIKEAAKAIRSDIRSVESKPWPPPPDDVNADYVKLPSSLVLFLSILISGCDGEYVTSKIERIIGSLAQDCMYAATSGRVIPAKHILLPWAVKSLTGNVELIKTLNRLGHAMSYTKLEEMDTALCLNKLALEPENGIALPTTTHPDVPATVSYDNIDRLEETLSGEGTSHRVNGIIVQAEVTTVPLPPKQVLSTQLKRRSITPVNPEVPVYIAGERVGPPVMRPLALDLDAVVNEAHMKNLMWFLVRHAVSSWTGFNILIRDDVTVMKDTVGYLPTINAPTTQLSTVQEILNQTLKIMEALNLIEIAVVMDQALYAKAAEITWKHPQYDKIVLRMGAFHTMCNMLSISGKRFGAAGLRDIAVESGIIAEGSIANVLDGRNYNRGIRLAKLMYEALLRLAWKGFFPWLAEHHLEDVQHIPTTIEAANSLQDDINRKTFDDAMQNPSCTIILQRFSEYLSYLRSSGGQLAAFWMSYIDMTESLLALVHASREGNWLLHLAAIRSIIPWSFAYDKMNYARYLSIYYCQMTRLLETHPKVHQHMLEGGFSLQLSDTNTFGRIPVDQTIEETANKDTQTPGGTKGFSLKPGAVSRYYITAEYRSTCLKQLRQMIGTGHCGKLGHKDLSSHRMKKDEEDIQSLVHLLEETWTNPFSGDTTELVSLSTGASASPEVAADMLTAHEKGEAAYIKFQTQRIEQRGKLFFDRLPRMQLKTFEDVKKKNKQKQSNTNQVLRSDSKLFGQMLLVAASRKLNMKDVLKHPLGPLPWSLANCDGTMKKNNKATLARKLESNVSSAEAAEQPSACVIDGMGLVQKIKGDNLTFNEVAEMLLSSVLNVSAGSERVDVVFDVYKQVSIKEAERALRATDRGIRFTNIIPGHRIQQWRRLLSCGASKMRLIKFVTDKWSEETCRQRLKDKVLYVTCDEICTKLTSDAVVDAPELKSSQEEADTRILLHCKHASTQYSSVIVAAEDTDVLILCVAFQDEVDCNLFIRCGSSGRTRLISITKVAAALGVDVCKALPGLHSYTGCDTVSAFSGRGKVAALKLVLGDTKFQEAFASLGNEWTVSSDLMKALEEFTCKLYVAQTQITDVNEMRFQLFRSKNGDIQSGQLPPCKDCLELHAIRACYQTAIWHRSLESTPDVPSPLDCGGWILDDEGKLAIQWMTGAPAPDVVLEFLSCKCKRKCSLPKCTCMVNRLRCTEACILQDCENITEDNEVVLTADSESESDYDSD